MHQIVELLGSQADSLLNHRCKTISKESLRLPGPDVVSQHFGHVEGRWSPSAQG
jgi:class I fructose-bisphosphate aldolase